jgi:hypothetical protein
MRRWWYASAMNRSILTLPVLLLGLCACGNRDAAPVATAETSTVPPATTAAPAPTAPEAAPTEAPASISSHGAVVDPTPNSQMAAGAAAAAGSIDFDLPKSWQSKKPSSSMRLAQAAIPGPGGDADFAIFYFGPGGGGPVEANIDRWVGQMEGASKPTPETFETHGLKVTWVDVKGTLKPSQMGMTNTTPISDARLYGAVVEGPGGPWFFKTQGAESTLGPQRDAFVALLKSVRPKA